MRGLSSGRYHTTKVEVGTTSLGGFAPLQLPRMSFTRAVVSPLSTRLMRHFHAKWHGAHQFAYLRLAVWCFALGFGGLAQLLAGMWEARRGKMFGESSQWNHDSADSDF